MEFIRLERNSLEIEVLAKRGVKDLSQWERAWIGALVAGEGTIGYNRGRVYPSGGREHPLLGPGNHWYPRLRKEMYDGGMIKLAGVILREEPMRTPRGSWLVVREGQPVIDYLRLMREFMPGIRGTESDFVISKGSPVGREIVDEYIRLFGR
ncbi:MAG: hypothetical protein ABSG45_07975 [Nitrososphaerales archaeon]